MRKSNLVLLTVSIMIIGTLSFTRSSLINKYRKNDVTTMIIKESKGGGKPGQERMLEFPAARYVIFSYGQNGYGDFSIIDSAIIDKDGNPVMKIEYKPDLSFTDTDKQFGLRGDTLFINADNLSGATIYTSRLHFVMARTSLRTKVSIRGFNQDSLNVISDLMSNMEVSNCTIRHCRFEMYTEGRLHSYQNKIDSLELYIGMGASLVLDDFSGKLVRANFNENARVELSGNSLRSFSTIKWDD
jgi:hypothetical protein